MKRIFTIALTMLIAGGSIFANEHPLIDFNNLAGEIIHEAPFFGRADHEGTRTELGSAQTGNLTRRNAGTRQTSFAIPNWEVVLASSARNVTANRLSRVQQVESDEMGTVLGARIHFPTGPFNSYARIVPPFTVPAVEFELEDGTITTSPSPQQAIGATQLWREDHRFREMGFLNNVGPIRSIAVNVYGLNFPHTLSVILVDQNGRERLVPMGSLNFDGWGALRWDNPQYVDEVRNRQFRQAPLYPFTEEFLRFGGFHIHRSGQNVGGDFIVYFRDVIVLYDFADIEDEGAGIDHEGEWNIIRDRNIEMSRNLNENVTRLTVMQDAARERQDMDEDGNLLDFENISHND